MEYFINLTSQDKHRIWRHLLPEGELRESAAFVFASVKRGADKLELTADDVLLIGQDGYASRRRDYMQLSDESRVAVIKRAHQTHTALIEFHSHPFDSRWAPSFSLTDMNGFAETVPHMWWRLPDRPYAAIVVAPSGFDALVWVDRPTEPIPLTALRSGTVLIYPTGLTLGERHVS